MPSSLPTDSQDRSFQITITPTTSANTYTLHLDETHNHNNLTVTNRIADVSPSHAARVADTITTAIKSSGHPTTILRPSRRKPIPLEEAAGVRLALHLMATAPLTRSDRIRGIVAGINAMGTEETYYWYAKTTGDNATRALRALRLLLADDQTPGGQP